MSQTVILLSILIHLCGFPLLFLLCLLFLVSFDSDLKLYLIAYSNIQVFYKLAW